MVLSYCPTALPVLLSYCSSFLLFFIPSFLHSAQSYTHILSCPSFRLVLHSIHSYCPTRLLRPVLLSTVCPVLPCVLSFIPSFLHSSIDSVPPSIQSFHSFLSFTHSFYVPSCPTVLLLSVLSILSNIPSFPPILPSFLPSCLSFHCHSLCPSSD